MGVSVGIKEEGIDAPVGGIGSLSDLLAGGRVIGRKEEPDAAAAILDNDAEDVRLALK